MLPVVLVTAPTPAPRATIALGLASLGFVSLGLPEGLLGAAWPSIRAEFGLPLDALGLLLATFAAGYVLSSAVSGRVLERCGIGSALAASCGLTGSALVGYALSPAWLSMVALGGVLGLGAGTIDAGLNTYAALRHGARVLNWMHAAFGLGAAVGPLLMTAVISSGLGWNVGYLVVAVAQLGLAGAYAATRRGFAASPADQHAPAGSAVDAPAPPRLLRNPLTWLSLLLFFVYVGIEATAGQWSFSLFTLGRNTPTTIAGVLLSAYWGSLTLGRVVFGGLANRVSNESLLRGCMLTAIVAAGVIWLNVPIVGWLALAVLGLALAPVFPVLIAQTPARLGLSQTAEAVGLQIAASVLGGVVVPATVGVLAARLGLEVVGASLLGATVAQLALHEVLLRRAYALPRSARSRNSEVVSFPPGA